MKYCKRCLYPANHPLNITFDEAGVCSGCRVHEEKDFLDWPYREKKLRNILDMYRNQSNLNYDCIIPVSGARDSYFIVHTIKNVYGMTPLLVNYNNHYNTKMGIQNLSYLRTLLGCDIITLTLDPKVVKKITRHTLERIASMYWHCIAGQSVFPVQAAVKFKIPLIIWGVHQGCDQVGMFSHLDEVEMTRKYRKEHDLMGFEPEDLIDEIKRITKKNIRPYMYPHDKEIQRVGCRGIYLSNYIRWDSKRQHEMMIGLYDYDTSEQWRTFDAYNDVDSFHYSGTHDYIKFLKYGFGKVTDHACREIRLKRLTREEGIELVKKYQNKKPEDLKYFLNWIGVTEEEFFGYINTRRDPRIWKKYENGDWELLDSVINHAHDAGLENVRLEKVEDCEFVITEDRVEATENEYALLTRGYVDEYLKNRPEG